MPLPTGGKAGRRFEAPSQDTGLIALVSSERFGALLRKEKDGASPSKLFFGGIRRMPSFSVLWNEGFFVYGRLRGCLPPREGTWPTNLSTPEPNAFFHSGLSTKNRSAKNFAAQN